MERNTELGVQSANIHVIGACNYRCEHCFDRCLHRGSRKPEEWIPVLEYLKDQKVTKINVAGGEPTLYPHLKELLVILKRMGFTTSIVSNGSKIDEEWFKEMQGLIDWIGLSIDSPSEEDEILIGRHCGNVKHLENIKKVAGLAHAYGVRVKINITVVRRSWNKDFRQFLSEVSPDRIKAFRALTLKNANDDIPDVWSITDEQFEYFRNLHRDVPEMVFEDNDDMVASYLMFDPLGRWMVDKDGEKRFLPFETLVREGLETQVDVNRYFGRNAVYDWASSREDPDSTA